VGTPREGIPRQSFLGARGSGSGMLLRSEAEERTDMIEKIDVYKVDWLDFLKFCETRALSYKTLDELGNAIDAFVAEALRIKTKYDN
jgi:hypothetical protein